MILSEEQKQQLLQQELTEEQQLKNFFNCIFYTDPVKHFVTIIIDGGLLKTNMKYEKFLKLIEELCPNLSSKVQVALTEYGQWYMIDRIKNTMSPLQYNKVEEALQIVKIHNDVMDLNKDDPKEKDYQKIKNEYNQITSGNIPKAKNQRHYNPFKTRLPIIRYS
jgi:hypothetical protein